MVIITRVKVFFSKVLSLGKPSDDDVLYSKVIKKEIPKESAEELTIKEIKETVTHLFHADETTSGEVTEFSRGTPTPQPVKAKSTKKAVKKKSAAKKPATKKTDTKKPASKKATEQTKTSTEKVVKKPAAKKTAAKRSVAAKNETETKTTKKKSAAKKPATKKVTETKSTAAKKSAPKGAKKAAKIALYIKDIKKHYGEVDEDFVAIIVKNLGPTIYKKDAELVSCSDPKELNTVRKNFLMKKLGIDASKGVLDAAIADVCQELKSTRTKYRATFYYALAKKFKKESVLS